MILHNRGPFFFPATRQFFIEGAREFRVLFFLNLAFKFHLRTPRFITIRIQKWIILANNSWFAYLHLFFRFSTLCPANIQEGFLFDIGLIISRTRFLASTLIGFCGGMVLPSSSFRISRFLIVKIDDYANSRVYATITFSIRIRKKKWRTAEMKRPNKACVLEKWKVWVTISPSSLDFVSIKWVPRKGGGPQIRLLPQMYAWCIPGKGYQRRKNEFSFSTKLGSASTMELVDCY